MMKLKKKNTIIMKKKKTNLTPKLSLNPQLT